MSELSNYHKKMIAKDELIKRALNELNREEIMIRNLSTEDLEKIVED